MRTLFIVCLAALASGCLYVTESGGGDDGSGGGVNPFQTPAYRYHCVRRMECGVAPAPVEVTEEKEDRCLTDDMYNKDYEGWITTCHAEITRRHETGGCAGIEGHPGGGDCGWTCTKIDAYALCLP